MRAVSLILSTFALAIPAGAQCEIARPLPRDPILELSDCALSGDVLALAGDGNRVEVFERHATGWAPSASLQVDATYVFEGPSVALDGDRLAVGMPEDGPTIDSLRGSVWVYERSSGWQVPVRVVPDAPAAEDFFGSVLALAGDVLVVAAAQQHDFCACEGPGRVLVFEHDGTAWRQTAELLPHDQGQPPPTQFGRVLDTDGQTIVVGDLSDEQFGNDNGAIYIYERGPDGWVEVAKLPGHPSVSSSFFGRAVAVDGATIVGTTSSFVHFFERDAQGWAPSQVLWRVDHTLTGGFGWSAALDGNDLVVGAPLAGFAGGQLNLGALHVYRRSPSGWRPSTAFLADRVSEYTYMGRDVALDGGRVLWIGQTDQAQLLDLGLDRVVQLCAGSTSSVGAPAELHAQGCDSLLANALALTLSDAPPGEPAWILASEAAAQTPFGNGTLCLAIPVLRLSAGTLDANGSLELDLDLTQPAAAAFGPGDTLHVQAVFRDTGFGAGMGTSAALALELH